MREVREVVVYGIKLGPNLYTEVFSNAKLSDKRKENIETRRDELKVMDNDHPIVEIVVEGVLSYKPRLFTLGDRYLQLEKILDAIDKARADKNVDLLVLTCKKIGEELLPTHSHLNALERCLSDINAKILAHKNDHIHEIKKAKL